ncbi:hypothetical protein PoB_004410500 [Plakobranchus ocellatus]|uniref:Uncharacterized protein n=1 Tax=Plakobranchus ocellatus TaxID=259542 RepID=A0AAV4BDH3_9GAST|nr:hypothetical protein PoB_004410500 [Plakobranchus ocellatus]
MQVSVSLITSTAVAIDELRFLHTNSDIFGAPCVILFTGHSENGRDSHTITGKKMAGMRARIKGRSFETKAMLLASGQCKRYRWSSVLVLKISSESILMAQQVVRPPLAEDDEGKFLASPKGRTESNVACCE